MENKYKVIFMATSKKQKTLFFEDVVNALYAGKEREGRVYENKSKTDLFSWVKIAEFGRCVYEY